jgi:hypothetical protein
MPPELHTIDAEPPGHDVIEKIGEVLGIASSTRLSSVAIVIVHPDGSPQFFWSDAPSKGLLVGSVARLQHALLGSLDG